ncbi:hypothetical protein [Halobacteriovorax sp. HLS]|uniref:hypothetical protein n=1 Tax=Halobacteriovorax sp. HLS TaxID=2234000 RepID=UPI000FDB1295|nr:hypothetical protein [Halobacteriovorax sp. HLS]
MKNDEFIQEYSKVIAASASHFNELGWWSTLISSKDRFLCPLQDYFFDLYSSKGALFSPKTRIKELIKFCLIPWLFLYRLVVLKIIFNNRYKRNVIKNTRTDYSVFRSFLYNKSLQDDGSYRDVFWGDLIERANEKSIPNIILVDPIMPWHKSLKLASRVDSIFLSLFFLSFNQVFYAQFILLKCYLAKKPSGIFFKETDVSKEIFMQYRNDLLSISAYTAMLNFFIYKNILKRVGASKFYLPYEGLPWERMAILAFRRYSPDTEIIGYQHAVVSPAALNYFGTRNECSPVPDIVFTLGKETKNIIDRYNKDTRLKYEVAGALRFKTRSKSIHLEPIERGSKTILIALEGTVSCADFLNETLKGLFDLKEWRVVIRTHPMLPFEKLEKFIDKKFYDKELIEISRGKSLKEDLLRSGVVFYWGSTVSLEALELGVPLINYTNNESSLNYDPNFLFDEFKWSFTTSSEIPVLLNLITNFSDQDYRLGQDRALKYVKSYFYPVDNETLDRMLDY